MRMHIALTLILTALLCGCASTSDSKPEAKTIPGGDGTPYHKHGQIQLAWFAEGFDFSGYDTLLISPTKYTAKERPNEVEMRNWAMQYVPTALERDIRTNGVFTTVTTRESDVKPGAKVLRLENTIIEYEKGGGGARYWAGLYGGGQPVLKVRGQFIDGEKGLCKFEAFRHGESVGARFVGAYMSDQDIQRKDIDDLGVDMSDFIFRARKHLPPH